MLSLNNYGMITALRQSAPLPTPKVEMNLWNTGGFTQGSRKEVEKGVEKLTQSEKIILSLIEEDFYISKEKMAELGQLSKKAVEYNIVKLKRKGIIRRVGPDKGGQWEIVKK